MQLYRIAPETYLTNFQGLGASYLDGARWNRAAQPVIYFALSASTALLEMGNYLPAPRLIPASYRLGIYTLLDSVVLHSIQSRDLPPDWAQYPYPASTQALGGDWLMSREALGLMVPSAAVPKGLEKILVVNPTHPDIGLIALTDSTDELFNQRIFRGI